MTISLKLKHLIKKMIWRLSPAFFNKVNRYKGQLFSIGVYTGKSPIELKPDKDIINPVLSPDDVTDVPANFVADPFMCRHEGKWYMFFEIMNSITRKGQIGLATSEDAHIWKYAGTALEEPFHLAYPHIFNWRGKYYMIPDTPGNGVKLYEATGFPYKWRYLRTLLDSDSFVDSSVFEFEKNWWMFTSSAPKEMEPTKIRSLRLYHSDVPVNGWHEHPASPIVVDNENISRPGGRVLILDNRPIRFAQDGFPKYGTRIRAFEILDLTTEAYTEREINLGDTLAGGNELWNKDGMHHVDAHRFSDSNWIACVDGWYIPETKRNT